MVDACELVNNQISLQLWMTHSKAGQTPHCANPHTAPVKNLLNYRDIADIYLAEAPGLPLERPMLAW